jgi:hypothetical protein
MAPRPLRWDRALGSETGRRTDHVPLPTLSQEADSSAFSFISPAPLCTLILLFSSPLPLFFIPSAHNEMPPAAVLRHLLFHLSHLPPRRPHRHCCRSQRARDQTRPTAAAFATSLPCTISPLVSPSSFLPPSRRAPAQAALSAPPIPTSPSLNEIGLDPGIDHLYAVKTIDEVHAQGGKVFIFLVTSERKRTLRRFDIWF